VTTCGVVLTDELNPWNIPTPVGIKQPDEVGDAQAGVWNVV
jgi:hypothetical protein